MLMAASWPSNSDAAQTNRNGLPGSGGFMLLAGKMCYPRVTRASSGSRPMPAIRHARPRPRKDLREPAALPLGRRAAGRANITR